MNGEPFRTWIFRTETEISAMIEACIEGDYVTACSREMRYWTHSYDANVGMAGREFLVSDYGSPLKALNAAKRWVVSGIEQSSDWILTGRLFGEFQSVQHRETGQVAWLDAGNIIRDEDYVANMLDIAEMGL